MNLLKLTWTFLKVGLFAFGGGASVVPILRHEVVTRNGWMNQDDFLDAYMLGSTMPGPIGTNLAAYFGHKVAGWPGALISICASVLPVAMAMVLLTGLYLTHRDNPLVNGMLTGIRPVVLALLAVVVWDFLPSAVGPRKEWGRRPLRWALIAVIFAVAITFNPSVALLIVIGGAVGLLVFRQ